VRNLPSDPGSRAYYLEHTIGCESDAIRAAWPDHVRYLPADRLPLPFAQQLVIELEAQLETRALAHDCDRRPIDRTEPRPNGPLDIGGWMSGWGQATPEKTQLRLFGRTP